MNRYFLRDPKDEADQATEPVERLGELEEVNRRRHDVLDFMLLRMTPEEIAEEMDEDIQLIKNDIKEIQKKGWAGKEEELEEIRKEAVAKLRYSWDRARKAFDLSQGTIETKTTKYGEGGDVSGNGDQNVDEVKVKTEEKAGDARFLQVMNDSVEKMSKVTGAQKHREVEINNNIDNRSVNILDPNRTKMPGSFDQFLRKPEGEMTPDERREAGLDDIEKEME